MTCTINYLIQGHFDYLNGTEAGDEAIDTFIRARFDGKSDEEAEVLACNVLQRAGYNVNGSKHCVNFVAQ